MTRTRHPKKKTKAPVACRWLFPLLGLGLGLQFLSAQDEPAAEAHAPPPDYGEPASFSEFFSSGEPEGWNFRSTVPEREKVLEYVRADNESARSPGFHFYTNGKAYFWKEWDVGTRPFVLDYRARLDRGKKQAWRLNGATVMVSTAPAHKMGPKDYGLAFSIQQQGIQAAVKTGFQDPFQEREIDPVYMKASRRRSLPRGDAAPRGVLSRGGSGGHTYSSSWHRSRFDGEEMWFRIEKTEDGYVKFAYYHEDGDPTAPVWRGVWELPEEVKLRYKDNRRRNRDTFDLYSQPLQYVNVFTTTNNNYGDTEEQYAPYRLTGVITQLSGITAPGKLPEIETYAGVVADGKSLMVRGSAFQEGAYATLNGKRLETTFRGPERLEVELAGLKKGEDNKLAVYNPDGGAAVMARPLRTGRVVEQVLPAELRTVGGEVITLEGYGFTEKTEVFFDGEPVEIVERVSGRELKIRTPRKDLGRVEVGVRNGDQAFDVRTPVAYADHPVLLASKEELAGYRERFNKPFMSEYRKLILRLADLRKTGRYNNSRAFLNGSYGNNIVATTWAYVLTGKQEYKDLALHFIDGTTGPSDMLASLDPTHQAEQAAKVAKAVEEGETVATAALTSWGAGIPIQVLSMDEFHIGRGVGVAYAYDMLYDELSPELRGRMLSYMQKMVDFHLQRIDDKAWWHIGNPSNTVTVGNGATGIIALAYKSLLEDPEALGAELAGNIMRVFKGVSEDGGAVEGTLYWNYGFLYQVLFGRALENAFGNDYEMLSDPRIDKGVNFAHAALGGDGNMFVFNDSQPFLSGTIPAAAQADSNKFMRWLIDAIIERYANEKHIVNETVRPMYSISAFLLRGDKPPVEEMPPLPTLKVLPVTHWAALRSAPDAHKQGVVAGIKGKGGATTHHAQRDQGGYVLHAHGERFVMDGGYGYSEAELHSVPLILEETTNKKGEPKIVGRGPHPRVNAPLMDGRERGDIRTVRADATPAYGTEKGEGKYAEKVKRVYTLVGEEAFVVLDDVLPAESGQNVRFQYQLETKPELDQAARSFALAVNGKQTSAHIFGPESTEMTIEKQSRRRGWIWKRIGLLDYFSVRGDYTPKANRPLITVFQPTKGLEAAPAPEVAYNGDEITVTLGSGRELDFARVDGDWVLTTI